MVSRISPLWVRESGLEAVALALAYGGPATRPTIPYPSRDNA
jgi:hypothetical protein